MARRVSLPAADDLFRPTVDLDTETVAPVAKAAKKSAARRPTKPVADENATPAVAPAAASARKPAGDTGAKKPSGRVKHDEKMTVYVTSDELLDLEHTRLMLRRNHSLAVDRGRLVREAVALALAEFEELGEDSALVKRLTEE